MFCKKCGNELKEGERFCGKCGTPVEQETISQSHVNSNVGFSPNVLRRHWRMVALYVSSAFMFLLEIILWFAGTINVSFLGLSQAVSMSSLLGAADLSFLNVLIVILSILAALECVVPLFTNITRHRKLILSKVIAILNLCFSLFVAISAFAGGPDVGGEVGFTFGGWFLLLINIGVIILLFYITSQTKPQS